MFSNLIALALSNLLYFALHVEGNGSFPKPLTLRMTKICAQDDMKWAVIWGQCWLMGGFAAHGGRTVFVSQLCVLAVMQNAAHFMA